MITASSRAGTEPARLEHAKDVPMRLLERLGQAKPSITSTLHDVEATLLPAALGGNVRCDTKDRRMWLDLSSEQLCQLRAPCKLSLPAHAVRSPVAEWRRTPRATMRRTVPREIFPEPVLGRRATTGRRPERRDRPDGVARERDDPGSISSCGREGSPRARGSRPTAGTSARRRPRPPRARRRQVRREHASTAPREAGAAALMRSSGGR